MIFLKRALMVLVLVGTGLVIWRVAATTPGGKRYGPNVCTNCQLGTPAPDAATKTYLMQYATVIGRPEGLRNGMPVQ
ncbi:hypothetical protein, partial [Mesorhizobium sp. M1C.F.Ca.ET.212.01.1.1]|uniref:hypothetical protein n=1 Tax=Mesorhizobium sp. M1C.F.Ca.ET.212.01.1.1 TaxID=2500527 RepID=UPI001AEDE05D